MELQSRTEFPALLDHLGFQRACEVGIWKDAFSAHLLQHSHLATLVSVDSWHDSFPHAPITASRLEAQARRALAPFGSRSRILIDYSPQAAQQFADGYFDFVYIDANHRYHLIQADIAAWWPKVRAGGILAGHDYVRARHCGVIQAVDEFVAAHKCELHLTSTDRFPSWWVSK